MWWQTDLRLRGESGLIQIKNRIIVLLLLLLLGLALAQTCSPVYFRLVQHRERSGGRRQQAISSIQLSAGNHEPTTASSSLLLNRHKQGLKQAAQLPAVFLSLATLLALRLTWLLHTVNQIKKAAGQEASWLWAGRWQVLFQLDSYSEYYLQSVQRYVFKKTFLVSFQFTAKHPSRTGCIETTGFIFLFWL